MDRRTSLVTAAAIAAAILAGGTAIAANVGVLGAASDDPIGELTAVSSDAGAGGDTSTSAATTAPTAVTTNLASSSDQQYQVQDAGMVTVRRVGSGIELGEVTAASGWTWAVETGASPHVAVRFTSASAAYVFTAESTADGAVTARVDQAIQQPSAAAGQPASPTPSSATGGEARDHDEEHDDDDDRYEEHDDDDRYEEHEGGDDDD